MKQFDARSRTRRDPLVSLILSFCRPSAWVLVYFFLLPLWGASHENEGRIFLSRLLPCTFAFVAGLSTVYFPRLNSRSTSHRGGLFLFFSWPFGEPARLPHASSDLPSRRDIFSPWRTVVLETRCRPLLGVQTIFLIRPVSTISAETELAIQEKQKGNRRVDITKWWKGRSPRDGPWGYRT